MIEISFFSFSEVDAWGISLSSVLVISTKQEQLHKS